MRPMIPTETIDTLITCFEAISALGTQLSADDWELPTDLPGWSVKDNLSHLIGTERALQQLPRTDHRATPVSYTKNPIGEMNEHEVDARRSLSGDEVLAEWNDTVAQRIATLRSADDAYFAQETMMPTGPGTIADFLHIRVLDCWLHEQDMRRAVQLPGHLSGPCAELTIDRLIRTIPIVVGKRAGTPEGSAVAIDITGGVQRHLVCEVRDGRAGMVESPTNPPVAHLTFGTEAFVVLAAGRRRADAVAVQVEGDTDLARRVVSQLNMMI
jgi:uncharacterized protein (TIGR03083 family)